MVAESEKIRCLSDAGLRGVASVGAQAGSPTPKRAAPAAADARPLGTEETPSLRYRSAVNGGHVCRHSGATQLVWRLGATTAAGVGLPRKQIQAAPADLSGHVEISGGVNQASDTLAAGPLCRAADRAGAPRRVGRRAPDVCVCARAWRARPSARRVGRRQTCATEPHGVGLRDGPHVVSHAAAEAAAAATAARRCGRPRRLTGSLPLLPEGRPVGTHNRLPPAPKKTWASRPAEPAVALHRAHTPR